VRIDKAEYNFLPLGPANGSAVKRFAIEVQNYIESEKPIPPSALGRYIAERITDEKDRQDFIGAVAGDRGSGKSYTCLWILWRTSVEISKLLGGDPLDYFDPRENVLSLDDAQSVSELLARKSKNKFQCLLIDDNTALGAHDWNTKTSKNAVKIFTTMRTMRNCIFLNAPQIKGIDNSIRDYVQISFWVTKSCHAAGFNIIRGNSKQMSASGKSYLHRLNFNNNVLDLWASFKPPEHILEYYDQAREESAKRLAELISETGESVRKRDYTDGKSLVERRTEKLIEEKGRDIQEIIDRNPKISQREFASELCIHPDILGRILGKMNIRRIEGKYEVVENVR